MRLVTLKVMVAEFTPPRPSVTVTVWSTPAVAPDGTVNEALNEPAESEVIVAGIVVIVVPSKASIIVEPAWKPAPVTVTEVPAGPDGGLNVRVGATPKEAVAVFVPSVAERE